MRLPPDDGLQVRCFCAGHPLLAYCGTDEKGEPWIHIKAYKQARLISEVVARGGTTHVRCRNCLRWQRITIVRGAPALREELEISASESLH